LRERTKEEAHTEKWADDLDDWDEDTLQKLYHLVQDRDGWRIKLTLEAYEHDAHGAW